ncbi:hypothetical protein COCON_G00211080 [Conger conger]|uniref:Uncharacterized protein n=1 Tax=Conger conger TaxID=82655 RepID=A0A9Q1HQT5_CONCO|nr:hypothetical protein COCON_G00211080 [Conger conger]
MKRSGRAVQVKDPPNAPPPPLLSLTHRLGGNQLMGSGSRGARRRAGSRPSPHARTHISIQTLTSRGERSRAPSGPENGQNRTAGTAAGLKGHPTPSEPLPLKRAGAGRWSVGDYASGILQMRYPVWPRYGRYLEAVSDNRHLTVATLEERPFVIVESVDSTTGTCGSNTVPCRRQSNKTEPTAKTAKRATKARILAARWRIGVLPKPSVTVRDPTSCSPEKRDNSQFKERAVESGQSQASCLTCRLLTPQAPTARPGLVTLRERKQERGRSSVTAPSPNVQNPCRYRSRREGREAAIRAQEERGRLLI